VPVRITRFAGNEMRGQDDYWSIFRQTLSDGIKAISPEYFLLDRYDAPSVWRERVYCYELYHQLRNRLPRGFPYALHGEIDKRGHENICRYFPHRKPNPDFVLHDPGTQTNLVVLEVKRGDSRPKKIRDDIDKLRVFTELVEYEHGILLFFGPQGHWDLRAVNEKVQVLWHEKAGLPLRVIHGDQMEWGF
jgi:hypothetical protein